MVANCNKLLYKYTTKMYVIVKLWMRLRGPVDSGRMNCVGTTQIVLHVMPCLHVHVSIRICADAKHAVKVRCRHSTVAHGCDTFCTTKTMSKELSKYRAVLCKCRCDVAHAYVQRMRGAVTRTAHCNATVPGVTFFNVHTVVCGSFVTASWT